jgi:hypothetical protein
VIRIASQTSLRSLRKVTVARSHAFAVGNDESPDKDPSPTAWRDVEMPVTGSCRVLAAVCSRQRQLFDAIQKSANVIAVHYKKCGNRAGHAKKARREYFGSNPNRVGTVILLGAT